VFLIKGEFNNMDLMMDKKIVLLSCCAPCSVAVIEKLIEEKRNFKVVFYNPNIHPHLEYEKRRDEQKALSERFGVEFIELEYEPKAWFEAVKGLENEPERGSRCSICFYMRLERVMRYAKENGYTCVASVLGVSRYKNLEQVDAAAKKASEKTGVPYLQIEGRKNGMQDKRMALINELALYSQNYCGCKPRL
jgi:predicted adenine nucleotide alpha hydrolase (AANH) superfamily ATPase